MVANRIRIASDSTPNGLFTFDFELSDILALRDELKGLADRSLVADKIVGLLWRKVDESLIKVREEIERDFRRKVVQAAEPLRASIAQVPEGDGACGSPRDARRPRQTVSRLQISSGRSQSSRTAP